MAIKKVIDLNADSTVSFEKPGQKLQGYYLGFKTVQTSFGPSKLHVFQGEGGTVGGWGSAQLDSKLATVPKGALTFITFIKKTKVPKGTLKNFDVEYDDEDLIDVSNVSVNMTSEPAETTEELTDEEAAAIAAAEVEAADVDPEEPDATEEEVEEAPVQTAPLKKGTPAPVTDAAKAKAAAILQKARAAAAAKAKTA